MADLAAGAKTPATRLADAERSLAAIEAGITAEDTTAGGRPTKTQTVAAQLQSQLAAARAARDAARADGAGEEAIARFERCVERLRAAYLASTLESTDPFDGAAWVADDTRDALGAAGVDAKIQRWQGADGYVKFAVTVAGGAAQVRVGSPSRSHVEIGGGPAVAAGLLRFDFSGSRPAVAELENTSGGYRPGPLRNATARAAIEAAGYAVRAVFDNPTGGYDRSRIAPY